MRLYDANTPSGTYIASYNLELLTRVLEALARQKAAAASDAASG